MDVQTVDNKCVAFISYIDEETGKVLYQDRVSGQEGEPIAYQSGAHLDKFKAEGYLLAYNGFPKEARYIAADQMNQIFAIILKHDRKTINPDEIDQEVDATVRGDYTKEYRLTVNFIDSQGQELKPSVVQTSTWVCPLILDKVTSQITVDQTAPWQTNIEYYPAVSVPVVPGYFADQSTYPAQPVVQQNLNGAVIYRPLGKIIPVLADGSTIPGAKITRYQNDPHDPARVATQQSVPQVTGYITNQRSLTPVDPSQDTYVIYTPKEQRAVVKFVDDQGHQLASQELSGTLGTIIDYNPLEQIEKLTDQGLVVIANDFKVGSVYGKQSEYTITFKKASQVNNKVTSINPPIHQELDQTSYHFTIHFVSQDGHKLAQDQAQSSYWNNDGQRDIKNYADVKVPVVKGYFTNEGLVKGQVAVPCDLNHTVVYQRLGKIIPVTADGQEIVDAPHLVYKNSSSDPTKVATNQVVPEVTGYTPEVAAITPKILNKDTRVVYAPKK